MFCLQRKTCPTVSRTGELDSEMHVAPTSLTITIWDESAIGLAVHRYENFHYPERLRSNCSGFGHSAKFPFFIKKFTWHSGVRKEEREV